MYPMFQLDQNFLGQLQPFKKKILFLVWLGLVRFGFAFAFVYHTSTP